MIFKKIFPKKKLTCKEVDTLLARDPATWTFDERVAFSAHVGQCTAEGHRPIETAEEYEEKIGLPAPYWLERRIRLVVSNE